MKKLLSVLYLVVIASMLLTACGSPARRLRRHGAWRRHKPRPQLRPRPQPLRPLQSRRLLRRKPPLQPRRSG